MDYSRAAHYCSQVKLLYDLEKVENKIVDGDNAYPNSVHGTDKGMSFELKYVSPNLVWWRGLNFAWLPETFRSRIPPENRKTTL